MIISPTVLAILVTLSLAACALSPIILLVLFFRESKKDSLW